MEESLSHIRVHVSAILAWAIASAESCLAGSSRIEPVHFLIAVLKVIDDAYHAEARDMGFDRASLESVAQVADEARSMLDMPDEDITRLRRSLRRELLGGAEPTPPRLIHRSEQSRQLFRRAAVRAADLGSDALPIAHLLAELLEALPDEAVPFFEGRAGVGTISAKTHPGKTRSVAHPGANGAGIRRVGKTNAIDRLGRDLSVLAQA